MSRKEYRAKWYQDNKQRTQETHRRWHYKARYGISVEEYDEKLAAQSNVCAICKEPETVKEHRTGNIRKLAVDHCHSTGKVRDLLCSRCNNTLGKFKEDPRVFESFIKYINKHKEFKCE